jgi:ElaB/YqjD/DUF883 family membrane-anchored ribosome-binding protein
MTDTTLSNTTTDDIDEVFDSETQRLDREADAILMRDEMQSLGVRPLRRAIREDAVAARRWGQERAERLKGAVEGEPVKSALWALGIGVLIGLLAAR